MIKITTRTTNARTTIASRRDKNKGDLNELKTVLDGEIDKIGVYEHKKTKQETKQTDEHVVGRTKLCVVTEI